MAFVRLPNVCAERPIRYFDNTSGLGKSGRIPGPLQRVLGGPDHITRATKQPS
jgi:hypothetical protein